MRKRVLLAEPSDAIRGVAETVLRQNNFEVISVSSSEKTLEVLGLTRPDLVIISAELSTSGQKPLYEKLQEDPKTRSLALLILAESGRQLPFPPEIIIYKPLDPKDFIEKVIVFTGRVSVRPKPADVNPLQQADLDDATLDEALGLDRIDVTDSEVLTRRDPDDPRTGGEAPVTSPGLGHAEARRKRDSGRVESVLIRDNSAAARESEHSKKMASRASSASGKLEILADQYGMSDPEALKTEEQRQVHDYEWFIDEMRKETQQPKSAAGRTPESAPDDSSSELTFSDPASVIDPLTPAPASPSVSSSPPSPSPAGGVERFLDEFKKEVERYHADEPDSVRLDPDSAASEPSGEGRRIWQDSAQDISPEQVAIFTEQLSSKLAERLAEKIAAKIDSEKLLVLIKNEILSHVQGKS